MRKRHEHGKKATDEQIQLLDEENESVESPTAPDLTEAKSACPAEVRSAMDAIVETRLRNEGHRSLSPPPESDGEAADESDEEDSSFEEDELVSHSEEEPTRKRQRAGGTCMGRRP